MTQDTKTLEKFTDEEIGKLIQDLENQYPQFSRLKQGYKMIGFKTNKNSGQVPIYAYMWPDSRYSCAELCRLRELRGVGAKERKPAKIKEKLARMQALDELARVSQELGLYETNLKNPLDKSAESV
jgi:hypothetical protein